MRKMKDSGIEWIGEIPESWDTVATKHLFQIISGATPKSENPDFFDGEIAWITPADYKTDDVYVSGGRRNITELGLKSCNTSLIPSESIIFSKRAPIGSVAINKVELCTNQGCLACVPQIELSVKFYYYFMAVYSEQYNLLGSGTTFKEISATSFSDFKLTFPPLPEQQAISAHLDRQCTHIDNIIEKTKASIEEYKKLRQAVITQAVTKGVRGDRTMKDSGIEWIGEIPEEWETTKVRYIGSLQNGISKGGEYFGDGYPFVSYGDIYRNFSIPQNVAGLVKTTEEERKQYSVIAGDIFFTRTSETIEEVGFSAVCETTIENATFAGFVIRLRPYNADSTVLTGYAKYYFRGEHIRKYLVKQMNLVLRNI